MAARILALALVGCVLVVSPALSSAVRPIDWHTLGPIRIGEPKADVESKLGTACRVVRGYRETQPPVECTIEGGWVWIDYSRAVGDCGPSKGCDRPLSCGLEGACREVVTSQAQSIYIGGFIPGRAKPTRLTFDSVGLGDAAPLGPCVKTASSRCAHFWNGLHFKRTFIEGVGYWASWQGRVVRGRLRMWVTVYTTKGRISAIWVEQY